MGKYLSALQGLGHWFERQKRLLPWRDEPTLYRVWISEIMLQQTQVVTVVPYFERFIARFPTVEALAAAPQDDVLLHWAGLGYYSRARNIHKAAQQIVSQKGLKGTRGGFPTTREGWLGIPGVGEYTAGAILSISLDQPEAILDGNVERVLSRIRRVSRYTRWRDAAQECANLPRQHGDAAYKARLWRMARAFVSDACRHGIPPSVTNQALMELGATICTPRKPKCLLCPMADLCRARAQGDQEAYPPRKKPKEWLIVREELHAVIDREGRLLVRRREKGEWRAGLWDFLSEKPEGLKGMTKLGSVLTKHVVTRHKITRTTHVWEARAKAWGAADGGSMEAGSGTGTGELRWIRLEQPDVALGSALKRTLARIESEFGEVLERRSGVTEG